MNEPTPYTPYHPRWHRSRVSTYWWLERVPYLLFILRELSSVFVAWSIVFLLLLIDAVSRSAEAYQGFVRWTKTPWMAALNTVTLVLVTYHAVTWFNLAPQAMVVRLRGKAVPGWIIAGSNYAAWAVVSAIVLWSVLRG